MLNAAIVTGRLQHWRTSCKSRSNVHWNKGQGLHSMTLCKLIFRSAIGFSKPENCKHMYGLLKVVWFHWKVVEITIWPMCATENHIWDFVFNSYFLAVNWREVCVTYGLLYRSPPLPIFAQAVQETYSGVCNLTEPRKGVTVACQAEGERYADHRGSRRQQWWGEDEQRSCVCVCVHLCVCLRGR